MSVLSGVSLPISRRLALEGNNCFLGVSQRGGTLGRCWVLCQLSAGFDISSAPGESKKYLRATANAVVWFLDPLDSLVPSVAWHVW